MEVATIPKAKTGWWRQKFGEPRTAFSPPNLVSYARLALTGLFVAVALEQSSPLLALTLFVVAASTDWVDGWLAKRNNGRWRTPWGAFIDPIIDKVLTFSALLVILATSDPGIRGNFVAILVLVAAREAVVGWVKARQPIASASEAGRASMVLQSIAIVWWLIPTAAATPGWQVGVGLFLLYIALGASLLSGWLYLRDWQNQGSRFEFEPLHEAWKALWAFAVIALAGVLTWLLFVFVGTMPHPPWPLLAVAPLLGAAVDAVWVWLKVPRHPRAD